MYRNKGGPRLVDDKFYLDDAAAATNVNNWSEFHAVYKNYFRVLPF